MIAFKFYRREKVNFDVIATRRLDFAKYFELLVINILTKEIRVSNSL